MEISAALRRLQVVEERYRHLEEEMGRPEVYLHPDRIREVSRERSDLEERVQAYREYLALQKALAENEELARHDADLRDLAQEEVERIRTRIPGVSIHCDVIVGFPGETAAQFDDTYNLLADLKLDKVHLARYSPRPHTVSMRTMPDDVPPLEKKRRLDVLEKLQEQVVGEINQRFLGQTVEVLVEDQHQGKWRGRTPQNKLVFFADETQDWRGRLATVEITRTGPWSMQARLPEVQAVEF